jgi:hypothetical protein
MMAARARGDGPRGGPTGFGDLTLIDQIDDEELGSGMLDDGGVAPRRKRCCRLKC